MSFEEELALGPGWDVRAASYKGQMEKSKPGLEPGFSRGLEGREGVC